MTSLPLQAIYTVDRCTKFDQEFEPYNEKFHYLFDFAEKVTSTQARLKFHPGVNSGRMLIYERHSLL